MGAGGSSSRPLGNLFGVTEESKRGPTLGSVLFPGPEASSWRLVLVSPLRIQVLDAHTSKLCALQDPSTVSAVQNFAPFTAFAANEAVSPPLVAVGCQDGTILVFHLSESTVTGPTHLLKSEDSLPEVCGSTGSLAMSITALHWAGPSELYAGSCGRCHCWDLTTGKLQREFFLPGNGETPGTPSALAAVRLQQQGDGDQAAEASFLWVGLDTGNIAVFCVQTGLLARTFSCSGPETIVALALFESTDVVFALSAHRRVSVWEASSYACLQKYPAELMTCGADLSAMMSLELKNPEMSLLLLAGVDGSLCVRRVSRRSDGKLNCVLLSYVENLGAEGCPLTSMQYHLATDSLLVGTAACMVCLLAKFREQLGSMALAPGDLSPARRALPPAQVAYVPPAVTAGAPEPSDADQHPADADNTGSQACLPSEELAQSDEAHPLSSPTPAALDHVALQPGSCATDPEEPAPGGRLFPVFSGS